MLAIFTRRFITYLMLGLAALMATLPLATPAEAGWRRLGVLPAPANYEKRRVRHQLGRRF